jgi:hypothetical protein
VYAALMLLAYEALSYIYAHLPWCGAAAFGSSAVAIALTYADVC